MYTSIALVALWASVAPQLSSAALNWERDYRQARTLGTRDQKPLAVFVGNGSKGFNRLVRDGLNVEVRKILKDRFIPVYINLDTSTGKQMADLFGLAERGGLIISDRTGEVMAYRHVGELDAKELGQQLHRLSAPDHVVVTTESNRPAAPTYVATVQQVAPAAYYNLYQNSFGQCQT